MQNFQSSIELFKRNSSDIISSPVTTIKCDESKLVEDTYTHFGVDINSKDMGSYRYIIARLFWFLIIHKVCEREYPKLYSLINKLSNQTLLVNIRSMNDLDEYMYETTNQGTIYSWYRLLKAKLAVTNLDIEIPDTVDDAFQILEIGSHMAFMERHLDEHMAHDPSIEISLRGLYDTSKSYISTGIIIPLTRKYVQSLEEIIDTDEKRDIQCYIKYDRDIMDDYIEKNKTIVTASRKYIIRYPVSISYESLTDESLKRLTRISFSSTLPYKKFEIIEKDPSYNVENIFITCNRVDKLNKLYSNDDSVSYDINIDTTVPESVLNFLKIKDILPYEVYLETLDPTHTEFYMMIERISHQRIER